MRAEGALARSLPPTLREAAARRLVCLTTSGSLGGAETSLLTLLDGLRAIEPGWHIVVIAPAEGLLVARCRAAGFETLVEPYPAALASFGEPASRAHGTGPGRRLRAAFGALRAAAVLLPYLVRLRRALRRTRADVVHSNGIKAHVAAALTAPRRARLVWHMHEYVGPRPSTARLLRVLSRRPSAIVVNSDSVAADVREAIATPVPIRRVHNAVDPRVFRPDGRVLDLASLAGLPADAGLVRIGLVGTFGRWKGHAVFLDAISRLPAAQVRAYVIGGALYQTADSQCSREELEAAAARLGITNVVGFTGPVAEVPAALRALDIVVHASTSPEPFGMVIAEAMAAGRAVVAVSAGGACELFEDGIDALGCRMGDAADLARQLDRLVHDARLRAALGRAARASAIRKFSAVRMAAEFRQVYAG